MASPNGKEGALAYFGCGLAGVVHLIVVILPMIATCRLFFSIGPPLPKRRVAIGCSTPSGVIGTPGEFAPSSLA